MCKSIKRISALIMCGALAITSIAVIGSVNNVALAAKKRVSKKPSLNKKSMLMFKGNKYVLKVKRKSIAGLKLKGKIKWTTSNKKVAKVKRTGKLKARVTALRKGKVTIKATLRFKNATKKTVKLTCKAKVRLKPTSIPEKNPPIPTPPPSRKTTQLVYAIGESVNKTFAGAEDIAYDYDLDETDIVIETQGSLPTGIKCNTENGDIEFTGKPEVAGDFEYTINFSVPKGSPKTNVLITSETFAFHIAGPDSLAVASMDARLLLDNMGKANYTGCADIKGGSGTYNIAITKSEGATEANVSGDNIITAQYATSGEYTITLEISDAANDALKITQEIHITVDSGITVSGLLTDRNGNYIRDGHATITFTSLDAEEIYTPETTVTNDATGHYTATLHPGSYIVSIISSNDELEFICSDFYRQVHEFTEDLMPNATQDFTLAAYEISINHPATTYDLTWEVIKKEKGDDSDWEEDPDMACGENLVDKNNNYILLSKGNYDICAQYRDFTTLTQFTGSITAAEITGSKNPSVSLTAKQESLIVGELTADDAATPEGTSPNGKDEILRKYTYAFYTFKPTKTAKYKFYSVSSSDPYAVLYDEEGNMIMEGDDDSSLPNNCDFSITTTQELVAGKTYYLGVNDYDAEMIFDDDIEKGKIYAKVEE